MSLNFKQNLWLIIKKSEGVQANGVNNEKKSIWRAYLLNGLFICVAGVVAYIKRNGFPSEFILIITNFLAIVIGLFITALIFAFDKFYKKTDSTLLNAREKLWNIQNYNYLQIFAYTSGYIISLGILLLSIIAIYSLQLFESNFMFEDLQFASFSIYSVKLFFIAFMKIASKFLIILFLIKMLYMTMALINSMILHFLTKIQREN